MCACPQVCRCRSARSPSKSAARGSPVGCHICPRVRARARARVRVCACVRLRVHEYFDISATRGDKTTCQRAGHETAAHDHGRGHYTTTITAQTTQELRKFQLKTVGRRIATVPLRRAHPPGRSVVNAMLSVGAPIVLSRGCAAGWPVGHLPSTPNGAVKGQVCPHRAHAYAA